MEKYVFLSHESKTYFHGLEVSILLRFNSPWIDANHNVSRHFLEIKITSQFNNVHANAKDLK